MEKIKQFIKETGSIVLYIAIGFLLGATVYTAHAAWNDTVVTGEVLSTNLWNNMVAKLIELDDRVYTEENTPQPACNYNGTEIVASRLVWTGTTCGTYCCGSGQSCNVNCRRRNRIETEMACNGVEVTGMTLTTADAGCACPGRCDDVGDDVTDETPEDLRFYREIIKTRKDLIKSGKTEETLHQMNSSQVLVFRFQLERKKYGKN